MRQFRWKRGLTLIGSGLFMMEVAGCTTAEFFDFIQTALLGVTAAGAVAIIQNI